MTQELLATGTTGDIDALIKQCAFPPEAFLLVERLPQQLVSDDRRQDLLRFARLRENFLLSSYTSGRVFSQTFELRWEQDAGTTRVVYLGEPRELPGLHSDQRVFEQVGPSKAYYLFGERLKEADLEQMRVPPDDAEATYYATVRIPRLLRYPMRTQAQRLQLVIGEYWVRDQPQERLFRFQDVQPADAEGVSA